MRKKLECSINIKESAIPFTKCCVLSHFFPVSIPLASTTWDSYTHHQSFQSLSKQIGRNLSQEKLIFSMTQSDKFAFQQTNLGLVFHQLFDLSHCQNGLGICTDTVSAVLMRKRTTTKAHIKPNSHQRFLNQNGNKCTQRGQMKRNLKASPDIVEADLTFTTRSCSLSVVVYYSQNTNPRQGYSRS